jgi:putative peptidoglycan lipid II flippase
MTRNTEQPYGIAHSATTLTILSILSPVAGLALELTLAWRFGASEMVDAFRIASFILLFGSSLFFGNLLPHVVIPLFTEYRAKGMEQDGWRLAFSVGSLLGIISVLLVVLTWAYPGILVDLLGPGLVGSGRDDALLFVRYFSVVFVLMVWSGVMSGTLAVYRIFWVSPATQIFSNLLVIIAIIVVGKQWGSMSIAVGSLAGAALMLVIHLYLLKRAAIASHVSLLASMKFGPSDGVKKAMRLSVPVFVMILVGLWSTIIANRELSAMPSGTVANYGYAWKLLVIFGILPTSLATVIFPALSEARAHSNPSELGRLVTRVIRMILFLTVPIAILLFIVRLEIVNMMFARGAMSEEVISEIAHLFGIFIVSAPIISLMTILYKISFAVQDTKAPAVANIALALTITWLVPYGAAHASAAGVAWATNVAFWISITGLLVYLLLQYRLMALRELAQYIGLLLVFCIPISIATLAVRHMFNLQAPMALSMILFELCLVAIIASIIGYWLARILKIHEFSDLLNYVRFRYAKLNYYTKKQ